MLLNSRCLQRWLSYTLRFQNDFCTQEPLREQQHRRRLQLRKSALQDAEWHDALILWCRMLIMQDTACQRWLQIPVNPWLLQIRMTDGLRLPFAAAGGVIKIQAFFLGQDWRKKGSKIFLGLMQKCRQWQAAHGFIYVAKGLLRFDVSRQNLRRTSSWAIPEALTWGSNGRSGQRDV